ncbi:hypothetical protein CDV50_17625 [Haematobacter massiliensis]|uniref:Uncharacterized protein n=1 Tax=Haematobacter massiliensis TaxID=195105 RepID=A0A086XXJ6_9RHOB|nr:HdeD family acid-resistance protein [Haematobacter massiliensis]KFI26746.1 hypothetical protein CN97_02605 [Haematobacter massiliensis]OWJ69532.1 hypothetical protein CDV50_17625 [Haematobacter massiliensis]OWJ87604.1 hypothetical protein CDV51_05495 [Haematobacter massiliensis]QBJ23714.1 HdeD family acid-resistance protein [Haematobacter massiliensis]
MTLSPEADDRDAIRKSWGWFLALGILLLVFGFIAAGNLFLATIASTYLVGILMIIAAFAEIIHAFSVPGWGSKIFAVIAAALYGFAGYFAFSQPLAATATLTLALGALLLATGVIRAFMAFRDRDVIGWGWLLFGGIVTAIAGLLILSGWPGNSVWVLGLVLAVDMIATGIGYIMISLGLKDV